MSIGAWFPSALVVKSSIAGLEEKAQPYEKAADHALLGGYAGYFCLEKALTA
jgi:hypothetical protein